MNRTVIYIVFSVLVLVIGLNSFIGDNDYFVITKNDVQLKIPKGFPTNLAYDFKYNKITPEGFMLGRKLFYDPILSADSSISCGFCHQRIAAFAHIDHALAHGINGQIGTRNVPALQNLIWRYNFMWDGGVNELELQPISPITNPVEMHETLAHVVYKLQRNKEYVTLFKQVFNDSTITTQMVLKSLAQFTGLMISGNSRFDKFARGHEKFSEQELTGYKLFLMHCYDCHQGYLFTDNSFRNIGLKPDTALKDSGRMTITGNPSDFMKFRVPSLRNVELTAPYMHDGRFKSLEQVLDYYANGVFYSDNYDPLIKRNVGLNQSEKAALIAFLKTLTDKEFVYDRRFADPNFR